MDDILLNFRRELTFSRNGRISKGEITIPKIIFLPQRQQWGCYWSITFIKPNPAQYMFGDDPLQAFTQTLRAVSALLRKPGIPDLKVWWQSEGDNGGLPLFCMNHRTSCRVSNPRKRTSRP